MECNTCCEDSPQQLLSLSQVPPGGAPRGTTTALSGYRPGWCLSDVIDTVFWEYAVSSPFCHHACAEPLPSFYFMPLQMQMFEISDL